MKDFKWEPRYTIIAVYTFLVIAASMLFGAFVLRLDAFWGFLQSIVKFLTPFAYGFGIAFILSPLVRICERLISPRIFSGKLRRNIALLLGYLVALLIIVIFFLVVIPTLADSVASLVKNIAYYSTQVDTLVNQVVALIPLDNIPKEIVSTIDQVINSVTGFVMSSLMGAVTWTGRVTAGAIDGIMGIIVSIYMLANKEMLMAQCKKILYALLPQRSVERLIDVAHDSNVKFSGFLVGKIVDSIIIGLLCALGMWIFKMPFVTLVSLIIAVTNIIPYFGPFVGAIPGVILVFIGGGFWQAIGFAAFVLVLQQFDGNVLGPAILGQSTGLSAMWVIFAILLFGGLYGFFGMVIGVPLLAVIFGLMGDFINRRLQRKGLPDVTESYASDGHKLLSNKRKK